jgi:hypothetical protein
MPPPSEGGQQQQHVHHAGPAGVQGIKSPMWLTAERFDDLDFSPDVCVADLRRYVRSCAQQCLFSRWQLAAEVRLLRSHH